MHMVNKIKDIAEGNTPYILPSTNNELLRFIENYKIDMVQQVVSSIEFAIEHNLPIIEVFQFKGSNFVVNLKVKEFSSNLENIYNYYLQTENYELCKKVVELQQKLKINTHEKKKPHNNRN